MSTSKTLTKTWSEEVLERSVCVLVTRNIDSFSRVIRVINVLWVIRCLGHLGILCYLGLIAWSIHLGPCDAIFKVGLKAKVLLISGFKEHLSFKVDLKNCIT